jgi:hypothetical protein
VFLCVINHFCERLSGAALRAKYWSLYFCICIYVVESCTCAREIVLLYVFCPLYILDILDIQCINLMLRRGHCISMYLMLIHEIIHATCVCSVAAVLWLRCMVHVTLFTVINVSN